MLHQLALSSKILELLHEVVTTQITLLHCAVLATDIKAKTPIIDETLFVTLLDKQLGPSRGQLLLSWLKRASTCYGHVQSFATCCVEKDEEAKIREQASKDIWCKQLQHEIQDFADIQVDVLAVKNFFFENDQQSNNKEQAVEWKKAAANFFHYFYDNYLKRDTLFPGSFFKDNSTVFGRQAFLAAFIDANNKQEICAVCDQTRYYSYRRTKHTEVPSTKVQAIIDHYLPRSEYPHFACHPYNLVPICYTCNSSEKGAKDPFLDEQKQRRTLRKTALPYNDKVNLRALLFLNVDLGTSDTFKVLNADSSSLAFTLGSLSPRGNHAPLSQDTLEEAASVLEDLYSIPGRWNIPEQSDRIRSTLFRRMRQFLGKGTHAPNGPHIYVQVHDALKLLLYYLDQEDQQKDPFAFAMSWMLVALLNEYTQRLVDEQPSLAEELQLKDPFLEELVSLYGLSLRENKERAKIADELCEIVKRHTRNASKN